MCLIIEGGIYYCSSALTSIEEATQRKYSICRLYERSIYIQSALVKFTNSIPELISSNISLTKYVFQAE